MSERLSVVVRVRPFLQHEPLATCVAVCDNHISIGETKRFAFDRVFDMNATSDDIYVALGQPLADSFLGGCHASIIAYGQTGAGKTFTMAALLNDTVQEVFCRLAEEAVDSSNTMNVPLSSGGTAAAPSPTPAFTISLTALEVYNETVGDLLSRHVGQSYAAPIGGSGVGQQRGCSSAQEKRNVPPQRSSLQMREDPTDGVYVAGLTEVIVESETHLLSLIDDAIGNRKTASTLMNATSSRSHCVITLTLQRRGLRPRCCFVDLAGSERLKKSLGVMSPTDRYGGSSSTNHSSNTYCNTANSGGIGVPSEPGFAPNSAAAHMREGININSGLLALGNVIVALCEKKSHVPYRSSKLTRLLQPMLEGNSRTAMVACVAPLESSLEETLNTLKYADRAKRIQIDPRLAVGADTVTTADAQQLIAMLREQLEEAKRRLAATTGQCAERAASVSLPSSAAPASADAAQLRQLLAQEQEVTKRLENDLFNAEYTAMVEVEKRKALENRVAQLEAYIKASRGNHKGSRRSSPAKGNVEPNTLPPSPRARLTMNTALLQQLEKERESLVAMRAKRVGDTQQLEAALAAGATATAAGDSDDLSSGAAAALDHLMMNRLTEEIHQKESQIVALQKENDGASAQLAQYGRELQDALDKKEALQEELRRAEAQLEKSAMERNQKEQEKVALRAGYLERIRRAEVKAAEYQQRVREAEQEVRMRQEGIDRTRQLQEKVVQLREEVRSAKQQSDQLAAAHQQEVLQLQRKLQLATAQVTQLHQQMDQKDAAISKVKKQLAEQQALLPPQRHPSPLQQSLASAAPPVAAEASAPPVALHKIPPAKQASARRFSLKQQSSSNASPSVASLSDAPPSDSSPVRITKRRLTLPSLHHSPHTQRCDAAQAQINRELQELERMEKELMELQQYRAVLLSAQTTDAPKWHRANDGFTRRLATIQSELRVVDADTPAHANLVKEERGVKEKLRQLQAYRRMFEDADEQLAEFDNRIDNVNEARKFHLQRIRRLQSARACDGSPGAGIGEESLLPSVRDIRHTRLTYSVNSLSHKSIISDTPPSSPLSSPPPSPDVLKSGGNTAAHTAAVEQQVGSLKEVTQTLQARLETD
ncbi:putative kinesin [Leptomonas seymouri]|uniref:Putative kinesin n=1 Tax=Leptomonas seymouri TaxID=5684 RepID=A0A0N1HST2_LEPSE|nr:putative kinesin [Leptomonas seymouri]|eukprot:KPI83810.1 putative kinesin [Leptomonas seymouri]